MNVDKVQDDEEVIDLRKFLKVIVEKWKIVAVIIILCTIVTTIIAFMLPKSYQSNAMIRIKISNEVAYKSMDVSSIIEFMKSNKVIEPVLNEVGLSNKVTIDKFVKDNLDIRNIKNTDLVNITTYGNTPQEAQNIALLMIKNSQTILDEINEENNSLILKSLDERLKIAEREIKNIEEKLVIYQQQKAVLETDIEYVELLRNREIALERYVHLVQLYEDMKIKEKEEAVNIQIIKEPTLAQEDMPTRPNKKIIIAIGFIVGVIISFGYGLFVYCRKYDMNVFK